MKHKTCKEAHCFDVGVTKTCIGVKTTRHNGLHEKLEEKDIYIFIDSGNLITSLSSYSLIYVLMHLSLLGSPIVELSLISPFMASSEQKLTKIVCTHTGKIVTIKYKYNFSFDCKKTQK